MSSTEVHKQWVYPARPEPLPTIVRLYLSTRSADRPTAAEVWLSTPDDRVLHRQMTFTGVLPIRRAPQVSLRSCVSLCSPLQGGLLLVVSPFSDCRASGEMKWCRAIVVSENAKQGVESYRNQASCWDTRHREHFHSRSFSDQYRYTCFLIVRTRLSRRECCVVSYSSRRPQNATTVMYASQHLQSTEVIIFLLELLCEIGDLAVNVGHSSQGRKTHRSSGIPRLVLSSAPPSSQSYAWGSPRPVACTTSK